MQGHTILVVEDNEDHALLVKLAARRVDAPMDIRIATDGLDAVAYLGGTAPYDDRGVHPMPDLVILDLAMPNMDGFGVLEWIRGRPDLQELPVVVLTSSVNPNDEARALSAGARAFHTKPASLDELGVEVRHILERWLR